MGGTRFTGGYQLRRGDPPLQTWVETAGYSDLYLIKDDINYVLS